MTPSPTPHTCVDNPNYFNHWNCAAWSGYIGACGSSGPTHGLTVEEVDKLGKQLATVQGTYDNVHARLATGRGNLVRQVETIKGLGANTKKIIATSLLENSQDDE